MNVKQKPEIQNILLAHDGSQHAQSAIKLLCDLPLPSACKVTVLSVFTARQISDHEQFRTHLDACKECLEQANFNVETELLLGYPAEKIIAVADQIEPDLIVLGAKGLRSTLRILLGGVAQQVIEYANWPVLVVRSPYTRLKSVLFATDGSECSHAALDYLLQFPLPMDCEIDIIHVVPPLELPLQTIAHTWPMGPEVISMAQSEYQAEIEAWHSEEEIRGRKLLADVSERMKSAHRESQTILRQGDTATEILEYAQDHPADLIVSGSRGLSSVKSWLLGSVSRKLVHYADSSVLVVKTPTENL